MLGVTKQKFIKNQKQKVALRVREAVMATGAALGRQVWALSRPHAEES